MAPAWQQEELATKKKMMHSRTAELIANGMVQEITEYLDTELVTTAFGK